MYSAKELAIARLIKPDIEVAQLDVTDLAVLQLVRKATGGGSGVYNATITNGIATFDGVTVSKPLVSLIHNLTAWQEGAGTPSPTNIRNIHGWNSISIANTTNYASYFRGLLKGTHGFVDLGDLEWKYTSATTRFYTDDITDISLDDDFTDMLCLNYEVISSSSSFNKMPDKSIKRSVSGAQISIRDLDYTDASLFTTAVTGHYLIYELAEPSTPTITTEQFNALLTAFNIEGQVVTVSIGSTVYGGSYNAVTGVLTASDDYEIRTIDENSDIDMTSIPSVFYWNDFFDFTNDTESVACNCYDRGTNRANPNSVFNSNQDLTFCCRTSAPTLYIKDTRFTTIEDYKTWLSTNPVKIYVKKANPQPYTIQLSPAVINTIVGEQNNVFANCGDIKECKYYKK